MKPRSRLPAVGAVAASFLILGACRNVPTPMSTAGPADTPKPAEAPTPISTDAARNLAVNCFSCHGPDGRSPGTIPSLHRLSAEEIAMQVKNFKRGTRESTVMGRHARGYSDVEIEAIARYIAGQK